METCRRLIRWCSFLKMCAVTAGSALWTHQLGWARTVHQSGPWAGVWRWETQGSTAGGLWTQSRGNPSRNPPRCRTSSEAECPVCAGQTPESEDTRLIKWPLDQDSPAVDDRVQNAAPVGGPEAALPPSHSFAQVFQVKIRETRKFVVVEFISFEELVWTVDVHVHEICRTRRDRCQDATLHFPHCC